MSFLDYATSLVSYIPATLQQQLPFLDNRTQTRNPLPQVIQTNNMAPIITRMAGVSGAVAVVLGAYGSHALRDADIDERRKKAFDTGSRYHLLHSLALLAAHQARFPILTSGLLIGGIVAFCGPCYHYSITGDERFRSLTPAGGIMFILGWLSFVI